MRSILPEYRNQVDPRGSPPRTSAFWSRTAPRRGEQRPGPAAPRAVALITTAGFWATCAALAQPSRAAVSYAQAEDACTEGTAGRGSKALRRLLSNLWVRGQTTVS